jgi:phage-related baseplate assembly protein
VPEISYGDTDPESVTAGVLAAIESNLGRSLYPGDPLRLFALAFAAEDINIRNMIDAAGRQNLLAYATGDNLDVLGDLVGVERLAAKGASATLRFTASAVATQPITIPLGTRVTPGNQVYFATDYTVVIPVGSQTIDVQATAAVAGDASNDYVIGEINQIVDPIANVPTVSNLTASSGGYDAETDDAYRERIRLGISRFSTAGPRDAYEFWARSASAQISDVYVTSPTPGVVDVYVLLAGGVLPSSGVLELVQSVLSADDVRPLTDNVTAKPPTEAAYTVNITYYIKQDDAARAAEIQANVAAAVTAWITWQRSAIGRDVNTSELIARMVNAGAKRVAITSPAYTVVASTAIATLSGTASVTYGGLEDD